MVTCSIFDRSDENEFMLTIWTGAGTLGMFMTSSAEPTRGTVEYPQHSTSLSVDYPSTVALLPNNTLEIHSMEGLSIVAVLSCSTTLQASLLCFNIGGYLIPSTRNQVVQLVTTPLIPPPPSPTKPKSPPIPLVLHRIMQPHLDQD
ncbi:hypothetical protein FRC03_000851 [Tulasnella sp. 419]|nr:hypothetical protein FRC03_000851 [Tulasnella sp. 419]